MRSSAARIELHQNEPIISDAAMSAFARELSDLCRKHGIGITGNPTLFVMEPVDHQLSYHIDDQSNLSFR